MPSKWKLIALILILVMVGTLIGLWPLYPINLKKKIIAATSTTKWSEYQKLTKMLSIGMDSAEVERILGHPNVPVVTQSNVQCWIYDETGPTAGWTYVAEFKREESGAGFKLCYVANTADVLFPNLRRFEMGQRIPLNEPQETFIFWPIKRGGGTNTLKDK